jgi:hypothetical protein
LSRSAPASKCPRGSEAGELEVFRRLLRRGLAEGLTVVRFRRGDVEREVYVKFPE